MAVIGKNGSIPLFPIIASEGMELFSFILVSKKEADASIEMISSGNYVKDKYTKSIDESDILKEMWRPTYFLLTMNLTESEINSIKGAYDFGLYQWPRLNNLKYLSRYLGLSKPTILYHIRNAESKILDSLFGRYS